MRSAETRWWLVGVIGLLAAGSAAAQVNGKLLIGSYKPANAADERTPCYWELENGFKEVRPDRVDAPRELAVVLTGAGEPAEGLDRVEVPLTGGSLLPETVVVRTGATILFVNDDEFPHELFAKGLDGFAPEAMSPRARRSFNAAKSGSWPLRDKVVPHLQGQLIVLPDLVAAAAPKTDGTFSFGELKAGSYVLKVFHGNKELVSRPVEVGTRGLTIDPIALTASADAN